MPDPRVDVHGEGRSLAAPAFPDDDGQADPEVRAMLATAAAGGMSAVLLARSLRRRRLLVSVVAVLDEATPAGGDKDSHMAVVSMVNAAGERGLLAFTGVDALRAWDPTARPVPALGRDVARAGLDDGAVGIVLDVAGPVRVVLDGPAFAVLADDVDLARVDALVQAALAPLTADGWAEVGVVRGEPAEVVDVLVRVGARHGAHPDGRQAADLLRQAAAILQDRADLQRMVPGGIGVTGW